MESFPRIVPFEAPPAQPSPPAQEAMAQDPAQIVDSYQKDFDRQRRELDERGHPPGDADRLSAENTMAANFVRLLSHPEVQQRPENVKIWPENYALIDHFLNSADVPSFEQISALQKVVDVQDLTPEERNQPVIKDVIEKTRLDYWKLTDEKREWYQKVSNATGLDDSAEGLYQKIDNRPPARPPLTRRADFKLARARDKFWESKLMNPGSIRAKNRAPVKKAEVLSPEDAAKAKANERVMLSKEESAHVLAEFWENNPRQSQNARKGFTHPNASRLITPKFVLGIAQEETFARLKLDQKIRDKEEFDREVAEEKARNQEIVELAELSDEYAALGVRPEDTQRAFMKSEAEVRKYNDELMLRRHKESVVAAGVGRVMLLSLHLQNKAKRD